MRKATAVLMIGATTTLVTPRGLAAAPPPSGQLVIRVYDGVGVAPANMRAAAETAVAIFKKAGISLVWRECDPPDRSPSVGVSCDQPLQPLELLVRITTVRQQTTEDVLGYSSIDAERSAGWLATVLIDRVEAVAARTEADPGRLLGRVTAHEVGHLLLGTTSHSASGLMRARWLPAEMQQNSPLDWFLSGTDASRMKRAVAARSRDLQAQLAVATPSDQSAHVGND
jgi:hypothetical protein